MNKKFKIPPRSAIGPNKKTELVSDKTLKYRTNLTFTLLYNYMVTEFKERKKKRRKSYNTEIQWIRVFTPSLLFVGILHDHDIQIIAHAVHIVW